MTLHVLELALQLERMLATTSCARGWKGTWKGTQGHAGLHAAGVPLLALTALSTWKVSVCGMKCPQRVNPCIRVLCAPLLPMCCLLWPAAPCLWVACKHHRVAMVHHRLQLPVPRFPVSRTPVLTVLPFIPHSNVPCGTFIRPSTKAKVTLSLAGKAGSSHHVMGTEREIHRAVHRGHRSYPSPPVAVHLSRARDHADGLCLSLCYLSPAWRGL